MIGSAMMAGPTRMAASHKPQNSWDVKLEGLLGNPLLNVGMGLLSQSGYSDTPVSFGEVLAGGAQGLQQWQGFRDSREDRELRREDLESRQDVRQAQADYFKSGARNRGKSSGYKPSAQYQQLVEAGYKPGTPEWRDAYNKILKLGPEKVERKYETDASGVKRYLDDGSQVFKNVQPAAQERAPSGYRWASDGSLEVIKGGPADQPKTMAAESAGRYAAAKQAMEQDLPTIKRLAFDGKGGVAQSRLFPGVGGVLPFTDYQESRELDNAFRRVIGANLRTESGAVLSEKEIDEAIDLYKPSFTDSKEVAEQKIMALETRIKHFVESVGGSQSLQDDPLGIR